MKTLTSLFVVSVVLVMAACEAEVNTAPPTVEKNETTIVNPAPEKKVETNTTIVNPPAEKKP